MKNLPDAMEKTIILKRGQAEANLRDFYRNVAEMIGYEETEDTIYDCRRILVAPDVQDAIILAYEKSGVMQENIMSWLAIAGPKVRRELPTGSVVIQTGFISSRRG